MSFLGEKILYELLNSHENWWCERAFMPWLDMKAEMERLNLPSTRWRAKTPSRLSTLWALRSNMSCPTPTSSPCWIWRASRSTRKTATRAGPSSWRAAPVPATPSPSPTSSTSSSWARAKPAARHLRRNRKGQERGRRLQERAAAPHRQDPRRLYPGFLRHRILRRWPR